MNELVIGCVDIRATLECGGVWAEEDVTRTTDMTADVSADDVINFPLLEEKEEAVSLLPHELCFQPIIIIIIFLFFFFFLLLLLLLLFFFFFIIVVVVTVVVVIIIIYSTYILSTDHVTFIFHET